MVPWARLLVGAAEPILTKILHDSWVEKVQVHPIYICVYIYIYACHVHNYMLIYIYIYMYCMHMVPWARLLVGAAEPILTKKLHDSWVEKVQVNYTRIWRYIDVINVITDGL